MHLRFHSPSHSGLYSSATSRHSSAGSRASCYIPIVRGLAILDWCFGVEDRDSGALEGHAVPVVGAISAAAGGTVFVPAAFLAMALPFFFAAFLRADFNFRLRIAFFVVALRLPDMGIPFVTAITGRRSYDAYLRCTQVVVRRSLLLASVLQPHRPGLQPGLLRRSCSYRTALCDPHL